MITHTSGIKYGVTVITQDVIVIPPSQRFPEAGSIIPSSPDVVLYHYQAVALPPEHCSQSIGPVHK
jgi:hypothetical protein